MESFSRLIVIAHIKNRNHGLCILYRMFSLQPHIRSRSLKKSLVKPVEKNISRNEAIIKLSELSSYLAYISFSYSKYPSISKLFKYSPRKPSVSQIYRFFQWRLLYKKGTFQRSEERGRKDFSEGEPPDHHFRSLRSYLVSAPRT